MNVWYHLSTIFNWRQALRIAGLIALCVALITTLIFGDSAHAAPGVNQTLSFQGRLLNSSGGTVADGYYNMQFKIYQDGDGTAVDNTGGSPAGSLKWTENHVNNASQGVQVKNGYFSVTLGSVTPFGSSVDWNQDTLWLSMNIGSTNGSCANFTACSPDGEMTPMKRLTAVPYAMQAQNANTLGGMTASDLIHNQNSAQQTTSNFWISGTGRADTALQAPVVDTATAGTLTIGGTNATDITMADDVTVAAGKSLTLAGGATNTRPVSPAEGTLYFDTDTKQLLVYADGKWKSDSKSATKVVAASNSSQAVKDAADYVADGTGDQTEINAALTAAAGGKVYLAEGTYSASATITIPNNTTLAGVGPGTIIQLADIDATDNLIENSDTSTGTGVTIQDLTLDGQDTLNTTGTQNGIYLSGMGDYTTGRTGSTIRNVRVNNFRTTGISYSNAHNNTLAGTTMNGMDATGTSAGVYVSSSSRNNTISNDIFTANSYAIYVTGANTSNNTLTSNTLRSNSYGIYVYNSLNTTITNNNFDETTNYAIHLDSNTNTATHNLVNSNSIRGVGAGIVVNNTSDNIISSNKIHGSGGNNFNNSIVINNDADRNTISDNAITDNTCTTNCYAISIGSASANSTQLSSNSIGSNGTINDLGTDTIYTNQLDSSGKLINKSTGGSTVQTSTNNSTAFQVQNAAGTSALTVDTTNNSVLVAGSLDTTTAAAMTIGSTSATSITIGKSSSNITTTILGTAVFKPTTGNDSTTAFQIQRADGTALLVADTTNQTITIGSGGNTITLSASGVSLAGTARGTKTIRLAAEYTGAVLDNGATGNNSGTMTSSLDLGGRMNFYRWTTSQVSAQSYDIVTQVPIPSDFSAWAASNPLSITSRTTSTGNGTITLELRDSAGTVQCNFTSLTMGSTNSWITNTPGCLSSGTYTPGDYLTMRIRMSSTNNANVDVGNIVLNYLSNK